MVNFVVGFVGLGLFGWSGTFRPEYQRPEIFQGRIGSALSWIVMIGGMYLVYRGWIRSEEHTSELQSLMRNSYAVFCLKKQNKHIQNTTNLPLYVLSHTP